MVFFRIRGPVKQLKSGRKGMVVERERESGMGSGRPGEQGQCQKCTPIQVMAPNVRKNATHKESSQEKSYIHRAKFNGRAQTARLAGEKMAQPRVWARSGLYRTGRLRKLARAW
jgi:hypothetical protein